MSTSTSLIELRFPRQPRRGLLLGFSAPRVAVGFGVGLLMAMGFMAGSTTVLYGAVTVSIVALSSAAIRVQGRYIVEWLPLVTHWQLRRLDGQRDYRSVLSKARPAGTMALPGNAARLRFFNTDDDVVYVHDPALGIVTAALRVEHSAMVLLDSDEQNERVTGWSRALSSLAGTGTLDHVAIHEETIPDTGNGPLDWFNEHWTHRDDWASREYYSLLESSKHQSSTHRTTVTLSVKVGRRGVQDAVTNLSRQRESFEFSLRSAGLRILRWLSEEELAQQIRQAYAPFSMPATRSLAAAGPVAIEESWASLRHDDGYSCVLALSEFPAIPVSPQFLHALIFSNGVRHTFTLSATVQSIDVALRQVRRDKIATVSDRAQKMKMGQLEELSDRTEYAAIEQREMALLEGHAAVQLTGLIVVSARNADDLERSVSQIKRDAAQCACEARVLYGMQAAAFVGAALPVGRAL